MSTWKSKVYPAPDKRSRDIDLSIIIVNWNTKRLLADCLHSVINNIPKTVAYEVIVVDNASSDGSVETIRDGFPSVQVIRNADNVGFVRANNQASQVARGRYLLLLNSDTVLLDDGIPTILHYLDRNPDVGVATGKVLNPDRTFQRPFRRFPHYFGDIFRHSVRLVAGFNTPLHRRYRMAHLDQDESHNVDCATGAYLFLRSDLIENGKVFDDDLFMYYEDTLLCYRAKQRNYRVVYLPFAPIIHYHGKSARKVQEQSIFNSFDSSVTYFAKVYGPGVARPYRTMVTSIWHILRWGFAVLRVIPYRKFSEKRKLFCELLRLEADI